MDGKALIEVVIAIFTAIGAVVATVSWLVRHYLKELKPNGGSSLNDSIKLQILPIIKETNDDIKHVMIEQATIKQKVQDHLDGHK